MTRRASDIAREARLYNDEPETPMLVWQEDYEMLMRDGAEIEKRVPDKNGSVHLLLVYDGLRFGYVQLPSA